MVKHYKKKPVVIGAIQLLWENWSDICDFVGVGNLEKGKAIQLLWENWPYVCDFFEVPKVFTPDDDQNVIGLYIPTLEGVMKATQGDYIIKGVKGEFYPCKPDVFEATYEAVD